MDHINRLLLAIGVSVKGHDSVRRYLRHDGFNGREAVDMAVKHRNVGEIIGEIMYCT